MTSFLTSAFAGLAIAAVVAIAPAAAQAPGALPNPPAASVALAKEIVNAKQGNAFYQGAVPGIVGQVKDSFEKDHLDKQKDLSEIAQKVVQDLKGRENEIGDILAKVYASQFTEQELKDLVNFYKTPLGKKVIENEPKAMETSMTFINEWSVKFGEEIVGRFRAEMKKRGKEI
jgi:hypothetical protein